MFTGRCEVYKQEQNREWLLGRWPHAGKSQPGDRHPDTSSAPQHCQGERVVLFLYLIIKQVIINSSCVLLGARGVREWQFLPDGHGETWRWFGPFWVHWHAATAGWASGQLHFQTGINTKENGLWMWGVRLFLVKLDICCFLHSWWPRSSIWGLRTSFTGT